MNAIDIIRRIEILIANDDNSPLDCWASTIAADDDRASMDVDGGENGTYVLTVVRKATK